jgi:hypothetical protein
MTKKNAKGAELTEITPTMWRIAEEIISTALKPCVLDVNTGHGAEDVSFEFGNDLNSECQGGTTINVREGQGRKIRCSAEKMQKCVHDALIEEGYDPNSYYLSELNENFERDIKREKELNK